MPIVLRTIYQYHFKLGNKIVHTGITKDLDCREAEHRRHAGWERGHIKQVGSRTTREAALRWEEEEKQRNQGKPTGPWLHPLHGGLLWSSIEFDTVSFVDDRLRESESDLRYAIRRKAGGAPAWLYVLLEHQSTADPWLRLRASAAGASRASSRSCFPRK